MGKGGNIQSRRGRNTKNAIYKQYKEQRNFLIFMESLASFNLFPNNTLVYTNLSPILVSLRNTHLKEIARPHPHSVDLGWGPTICNSKFQSGHTLTATNQTFLGPYSWGIFWGYQEFLQFIFLKVVKLLSRVFFLSFLWPIDDLHGSITVLFMICRSDFCNDLLITISFIRELSEEVELNYF